MLYEVVTEGNETNDDSELSESEQIRAISVLKKDWKTTNSLLLTIKKQELELKLN